MMKKIVFLASLLLASPAFAQGGNIGPMAPELREKLRQMEHQMNDYNKDGLIDMREQAEALMKAFDAADTNQDGIISAEERAASLVQFQDEKGKIYGSLSEMHTARQEKTFNTMDLNKDGTVSQAEFDVYNKERYQGMDHNGDGVISPDEYRFKGEKVRRWKEYE